VTGSSSQMACSRRERLSMMNSVEYSRRTARLDKLAPLRLTCCQSFHYGSTKALDNGDRFSH
jgi:hypothetical protein